MRDFIGGLRKLQKEGVFENVKVDELRLVISNKGINIPTIYKDNLKKSADLDKDDKPNKTSFSRILKDLSDICKIYFKEEYSGLVSSLNYNSEIIFDSSGFLPGDYLTRNFLLSQNVKIEELLNYGLVKKVDDSNYLKDYLCVADNSLVFTAKNFENKITGFVLETANSDLIEIKNPKNVNNLILGLDLIAPNVDSKSIYLASSPSDMLNLQSEKKLSIYSKKINNDLLNLLDSLPDLRRVVISYDKRANKYSENELGDKIKKILVSSNKILRLKNVNEKKEESLVSFYLKKDSLSNKSDLDELSYEWKKISKLLVNSDISLQLSYLNEFSKRTGISKDILLSSQPDIIFSETAKEESAWLNNQANKSYIFANYLSLLFCQSQDIVKSYLKEIPSKMILENKHLFSEQHTKLYSLLEENIDNTHLINFFPLRKIKGKSKSSYPNKGEYYHTLQGQQIYEELYKNRHGSNSFPSDVFDMLTKPISDFEKISVYANEIKNILHENNYKRNINQHILSVFFDKKTRVEN
ncbi:hypothetical protein K9L97_01485 [Candidatus Woesearchaeota archaeon]|nr:hypothetical protein [Candidatus Woesearchaeota archaeon]